MFTEPLSGHRHVNVRERKTAIDWVYEIKGLLGVHYPEAQRIRLVCDNLNTHKIGSLYEAFSPDEARQFARRLEIHYTPKHGELVEYRRNQVECPDNAIPQPAHSGYPNIGQRNQSKGKETKQTAKKYRLAI